MNKARALISKLSIFSSGSHDSDKNSFTEMEADFLPFSQRKITNRRWLLRIATLLLLWTFVISISYLKCNSSVLYHPTDSQGALCGVKPYQHQPYLMIFDPSTCQLEWDIEMGCLIQSMCVGECPFKTWCKGEKRGFPYCINAINLESEKHYCADFYLFSEPSIQDVCMPIEYKIYNGTEYPDCPLGTIAISDMINGYKNLKIFYENNHIHLWIADRLRSIMPIIKCVVINALICICISGSMFFSIVHAFVLFNIIAIAAITVAGVLFWNSYMDYKKNTIIWITLCATTFCVLVFWYLKLVLIYFIQQPYLIKQFNACRMMIERTKEAFLFAVIGIIFHLTYFYYAMYIASFPLLITTPVFKDHSHIPKNFSALHHELPTCKREDDIRCLFSKHEFYFTGYILVILHIAIFHLFEKVLYLIIYYVVANIVSSWYYRWHESKKGMSHSAIVGLERAIFLHLGTLYYIGLDQAFNEVYTLVNAFYYIATDNIYYLPVQTWHISETVLFGSGMPFASETAYHKDTRNVELMINSKRIVHWMLKYTAACMALLTCWFYLYAEDKHLIDNKITLLILIIGCYSTNKYVFLINRCYIETLFACVLNEVDGYDRVDLSQYIRPEIAKTYLNRKKM